MPHEKKVAGLICLLLLPAPLTGEETAPSIHQQAAACREAYTSETCDEVCLACHLSTGTGAQTPFAMTVDSEFPGLYPAANEEDPWLGLSKEHKSCRGCHADYAEDAGNHPIFVAGETSFFSEETESSLKYFDGQILCATCHDPHLATPGLLRVSNAGSALCLACHRK